jgi:hypothetical protein
MQGKTAERWREVCEKVVVEQDHDRLLKLVAELTRLLEEKEARLKKAQQPSRKAGGWPSLSE